MSDGDRAAARELYVEGVRLQEGGKFDAALERFQRAQSVFSAPTHLLHIAECQAALGRLVESAETYRTLVRTPLPAGSPNAFVQAQQQGNAELTQVEPRIPGMKIQVKPENVQNLNVQIDGQPMSAALVGVSRPANPGEHTVAVFAPGYGKTEQKVTLKEKEQKEITLMLQPTSGVVYGPALTPLPASQPPPPPPSYGGQTQSQLPPDAPPVYQPPQDRKRGPTTSFLIGPRVGLSIPGGSTQAPAAGADASTTSVSQAIGVGGSFGVEGGIRFARVFYFGLVFDHGIYSRGPALEDAANKAPAGISVTSTNSSNYLGLDFVWISNPEGIGFYGELGLGYRWLKNSTRAESDNNASNFQEVSTTYGGSEGTLGIGIHLRLSDSLRLIPKATISAGSFSKVQGGCDSGGSSCTAAQTYSQDISNTDTHSVVFIGIVGFFDIGKHGTP